MKLIYAILIFVSKSAFTQTTEPDNLRVLISPQQPDTVQLMKQIRFCHAYLFRQPDTAILYGKQILHLSQIWHFTKAESRISNIIGQALRLTGDLPQAMEIHLHALQISQNDNDPEEIANSLSLMGVVYIQVNDFKQGLQYLRQALEINQSVMSINILTMSVMGEAYEKMNRLDSAVFFQQKAYSLLSEVPKGNLHSLVMTRMGVMEVRLHNDARAMFYYREALENALITADLLNCSRIQYRIAELYYKMSKNDSSLWYARMAYLSSGRVLHKLTHLSVSNLLVKLFRERNRPDSALYYQDIAMAVNDSLYGPARYQQLQLLALSAQQQRQQLVDAERRSKERFQIISWCLSLLFVLLIVLMLWRSNRRQKLANQVLQEKNNHIEEQRNLLQTMLTELELAQAKVIEKEKLAAIYQQELQLQQVRNKIAAELHDDIGSTLSSIHLFSEVARKHLNAGDSTVLPVLEKIKTSSSEMMLAMNEIVWSIQSKNDDVEQMVEKIHSFAAQLLSASSIALRFNFADPGNPVPLGMEHRRNLYLICKEALNNIVRHSTATEVELNIRLEQKDIFLEITDNGRGFDTRQIHTGNGLQNLYHRAASIGAELRIDSGVGEGSRIYLKCAVS